MVNNDLLLKLSNLLYQSNLLSSSLNNDTITNLSKLFSSMSQKVDLPNVEVKLLNKENLNNEFSTDEQSILVNELISNLLVDCSNKEVQELIEFIESISFIDTNKDVTYSSTELMHPFSLPEQPSEYDLYVDNHYAFISDFYPVNNTDVKALIKAVRLSLKKQKHTSAIDIYKSWINYLKNYNQDYRLYDIRNFNDEGEFIGRFHSLNKKNDSVLDDFVSIKDEAITYNEAAAQKEREKKQRDEAEALLRSGIYHSEIDPSL